MSAADHPVVMCDAEDGCEEWAIDITLHGLGRIVGSETQLPDGWTGDAPGTGKDQQFCPRHRRGGESATREGGHVAERCPAVDEYGMGRCTLDADHEPSWIGITNHAWEKVPGPPGPPQRWQAVR